MNIGYLTRTNMEYIEELFQKYMEDPTSVSLDWQRFFEGVSFGQNMAGLSKSEINVYDLIQTYREYGYFRAKLEPLAHLGICVGNLAGQGATVNGFQTL